MKKQEIKSYWVYTTATWDAYKNKYTNLKRRHETKKITMQILTIAGKKILKFIGGPTGFENYYIEDLNITQPKKQKTSLLFMEEQ